MEIELKLYGILRRYRPENAGGASRHPFVVQLPEGADVATLASRLQIPDGMINGAILNDEAVGIEARLQDGDKVGLFPPTAGG